MEHATTADDTQSVLVEYSNLFMFWFSMECYKACWKELHGGS